MCWSPTVWNTLFTETFYFSMLWFSGETKNAWATVLRAKGGNVTGYTTTSPSLSIITAPRILKKQEEEQFEKIKQHSCEDCCSGIVLLILQPHCCIWNELLWFYPLDNFQATKHFFCQQIAAECSRDLNVANSSLQVTIEKLCWKLCSKYVKHLIVKQLNSFWHGFNYGISI